jgi:minor extracellular serine protease Vpr
MADQSATKKLTKSLHVAISALLIFVPCTVAVAAELEHQRGAPVERFVSPQNAHDSEEPQDFIKNRFIVVLDQSPLLAVETDAKKAGLKAGETKKFASAHRQTIESQQASFATAMLAQLPRAKVGRRYSDVLNGVLVSSDAKDTQRTLENLPGVKYVVRDKIVSAHMDVSLPLIKAPEAWTAVGGRDTAGQGIKVAIIDSGIIPEHPMFEGDTFQAPSDLPDDDYCSTVDPSFCNGKLIVARRYTPPDINENEIDSPYDVDGHGTHVAGTAVGNRVSTSEGVELSGVAPGAFLMAYKALWSDGEGSATGSTSGLIQALSDAVSDGADIINNSWGGGASSADFRLYSELFAQIEASGVLLATSAGNSGPSAGTVGCPACAESGLAVASSNTVERSTNISLVSYRGESYDAVPGADVIHTSDLVAEAITASSIDSGNADACAPYEAGSFDGAVGIVYRGGETPEGGPCYFRIKASNLKDAGAVGMLVINNVPGDAIIMGGLTDSLFPSVMISQTQGADLYEDYDDGFEITLGAFQNIATRVGTISDFSSRGPNFEASILKPDVTAPGSPILSAAIGVDSSAYIALSGTSMASPHVAGAAAVLLQNNPELTAQQAKSALMNSADPQKVTIGTEATTADTFASGAGALNLEEALQAKLFWETPSLADNCFSLCDYVLSGRYEGEAPLTLQAQVELSDNSIVANLPETIDVVAGQTIEFPLSLDVSNGANGWLTGRLIISDPTDTISNSSIPLAVFVGAQINPNVLDIDGTVSAGVPSTISVDIAGAPKALPNSIYQVAIATPQNMAISEPSVSAALRNAETLSLTIDTEEGAIDWSGSFNELDGAITSGDFFGTPFSLKRDFEASITHQLDCGDITLRPEGCDDLFWGFDIANQNIQLAGVTIENIAISTNGLLLFNHTDEDLSGSDFIPQSLPSSERPNSVIAPFWTDLVLGSYSAGSDLLMGVVEDGSDLWTVIEWWNASEYGNTDAVHTFSVWMKHNSNELHFNYTDIGALTDTVSVGVEDSRGASAVNHYFTGTGTAPATNSSRSVEITSFKGTATVSFTVNSAAIAQLQDGSISVPANGVENFDASVLAADIANVTDRVESTLTVERQQFEADLEFRIPSGELNYRVVDQPTNGSVLSPQGEVTSNTGIFEYRPSTGFVGTDSFTFKVFDTGNSASESNLGTVSVLVEDTGIDSDGDGLSDQQEYELGTDPQSADSDGDGYSDGEEVAAGSDPKDAESLPSDSEGTEADSGLPIWMIYIATDPVASAKLKVDQTELSDNRAPPSRPKTHMKPIEGNERETARPRPNGPQVNATIKREYALL